MTTLTVPGTTVSLLTVTSKMPSKSWSITAVRSCPSAFFGADAKIVNGERINVDPESICGKCYATKGMYVWACVRHAQDVRFKWAVRASMDAAEGDRFVELLTLAIGKEAARQERKYYREVRTGDRELGTFEPVYRVHDSGDLFSPAYAKLWERIAQACPDIRFWFPTRQWRSQNPHMVAAIKALAALPNVAVRPSALMFNDAAPIVLGLSAGTTAATAGFTCPASSQDNECRDCRACWSKDVEVSYRKH